MGKILFSLTILGSCLTGNLFAVLPTAKTVPWVATTATVPHDTVSGVSILLKGTSDVAGGSIVYWWDPGDGGTCPASAATPQAVTTANQYSLQCAHTYSGPAGSVFTATLYVKDNAAAPPNSSSATYYVAIRVDQLSVRVNMAIDAGLWYMHKNLTRGSCSGTGCGDWNAFGAFGVSAAFLNAFEVNGHVPNSLTTPFGEKNYVTDSNPYVETVVRSYHTILNELTPSTISPFTVYTAPTATTFNPDVNGNGIGIYMGQSDELYQGGMFMDALVATGTPEAIASMGTVGSPATKGVKGRKLKDIMQDMIDYYSYCIYPGSGTLGQYGGGWRYGCQNFPDGSANQWAAIGLLGALRSWNSTNSDIVAAGDTGVTLPALVPAWNKVWINYSNGVSNPGTFGYTQADYFPWGPYAVTPSGMVQMALSRIGRGDSRWDKAEKYMFNTLRLPPTGDATTSVKSYYYGLFSTTKSMLLHDNGTGTPGSDPITNMTDGTNTMDWYAADGTPVISGVPVVGVARTLVNAQASDGSWTGHYYSGAQNGFETGWAVIMLNRTVFSSGQPVACATATPNPVSSGGTVQLRGNCSFQQDQSKQIISWDWDPTGGTNFTLHGVNVSSVFSSNAPPQNFNVRLRVTDNSSPAQTADTIITVTVNAPPTPPTANAGGPYNFCPQLPPFYLDGSKSTNPDDGKHESGAPPSQIVAYAWDFTCSNAFNSSSAISPRVDGLAPFTSPGTFNSCLRVTNNDNLAFPSAGLSAGLSSVSSATVTVHAATDQFCSKCVTSAQAVVRIGTPTVPAQVQLYWVDSGADHYNIYRSTANNGPYTEIAQGIKTTQLGLVYIDNNVSNHTTYYYRVAPATLNDTETCQSNQTFTAVIGGR
jgi:hypothetical protein